MEPKKRPIVIAVIVLLLSTGNYSRLSDSDCIRTVHLLTLLTMGAAIGIILQELVKRFKERH